MLVAGLDACSNSTSGNGSRTTSSRVIPRSPPERRPRRLFVHTCGREHLRAGALAAMQGYPAGRHAEGLGDRAARLLGRGAAHRRCCHPDHESASSDLPPRPRARPHSDLDQNASRYRANHHPTSRKVTQGAVARQTSAAGNRPRRNPLSFEAPFAGSAGLGPQRLTCERARYLGSPRR